MVSSLVDRPMRSPCQATLSRPSRLRHGPAVAKRPPALTPMTRSASRTACGPGSRVGLENLKEEVWEWRIEGTPPTEETYFMVHFDTTHGGVKKTSKRVAMRG